MVALVFNTQRIIHCNQKASLSSNNIPVLCDRRLDRGTEHTPSCMSEDCGTPGQSSNAESINEERIAINSR